MKVQRYFALILLGLMAAGCHEHQQPVVKTSAEAPAEPAYPTQAQPKLPTIKLWVGPEEISAEMALSRAQITTGMMFRTNIAETDSMIFVLGYPQRAAFWMKNCPESISAAYIDPEGVIKEIHHLEKQDTNSVVASSDDIAYVLETREGWFNRHHIRTGMLIRTERGTLAETFRGNN